jgi:hypothetical protein
VSSDEQELRVGFSEAFDSQRFCRAKLSMIKAGQRTAPAHRQFQVKSVVGRERVVTAEALQRTRDLLECGVIELRLQL